MNPHHQVAQKRTEKTIQRYEILENHQRTVRRPNVMQGQQGHEITKHLRGEVTYTRLGGACRICERRD